MRERDLFAVLELVLTTQDFLTTLTRDVLTFIAADNFSLSSNNPSRKPVAFVTWNIFKLKKLNNSIQEPYYVQNLFTRTTVFGKPYLRYDVMEVSEGRLRK